jgi:hypothetical protein
MMKIEDILLMGDYFYWVYEYILLLLIWKKLKKKTITIPSGKYNVITTRKAVKLGDLYIRVSIISLEGILLIYPYPLVFDREIKVLFFSYSAFNN